MTFLNSILKTTSSDILKKENEDLKTEITNLKNKLLEKQEQINKVNAYWKRRFYKFKLKKSNKV